MHSENTAEIPRYCPTCKKDLSVFDRFGARNCCNRWGTTTSAEPDALTESSEGAPASAKSSGKKK